MEQCEPEVARTEAIAVVGSISEGKLAANRRNAQVSTGPKTDVGKSHSRRNALKHGILASQLLIKDGSGAEDATPLEELLRALRRELAPVSELEEILVERIAICFWRQRRALQCEAGAIRRRYFPGGEDFERLTNPGRAQIKGHLCLPSGADLDRILRYESSIQRQLSYAINQLERLQRARKGEHVPAPVQVEVSSSE